MDERSYLTVEQLSEKIHYAPRYIRERLLKTVFRERVHFFYPFGGRRILFIREAIERDMMVLKAPDELPTIPLSRGGVCHG